MVKRRTSSRLSGSKGSNENVQNKKRPRGKGKTVSTSNATVSDSVGSDSDFVFRSSARKRTKFASDKGESVRKTSKRMRPEQKDSFDDDCAGGNKTCYRSNLRSIVKDLNNLEYTSEHLCEMKKTPFWMLFDSMYGHTDNETKILMSMCKKDEDDIKELILAFDTRAKKFVLGKDMVCLCARDVQLIFGLSGGKQKIPLKMYEYVIPPWMDRVFKRCVNVKGRTFIMYKRMLYEKLEVLLKKDDEESIQDVSRVTICYLLAALLCTKKNSTMSTYLTQYLEDLDSIKLYDATYFLSCFSNHKNKSIKSSLMYNK